MAFTWPGINAFALLFLIAAWAIVTGIMQIVAAFALPLGTGREWLLGLAGLASVVFGVLIATWPRSGLVAVVWLIGIYAIVFGVLFMVRYFQTRSMAANCFHVEPAGKSGGKQSGHLIPGGRRQDISRNFSLEAFSL